MSRNTQPKEPIIKTPLQELVVHSIWPTIQGEGVFAGERAVFIRLSGCNLDCPSCDTDYTSIRTPMDVEQIVGRIKHVGKQINLVVITGGEPFRQPYALRILTERLVWLGYNVQIETNGTYYEEIPKEVILVCSPKTPIVHPQIQKVCRLWKYVLQHGAIDETDGLPISALENGLRPARPMNADVIYVQPLEESNLVCCHRNIQAAMDSTMRFGYRLCLQIHKLIGAP